MKAWKLALLAALVLLIALSLVVACGDDDDDDDDDDNDSGGDGHECDMECLSQGFEILNTYNDWSQQELIDCGDDTSCCEQVPSGFYSFYEGTRSCASDCNDCLVQLYMCCDPYDPGPNEGCPENCYEQIYQCLGVDSDCYSECYQEAEACWTLCEIVFEETPGDWCGYYKCCNENCDPVESQCRSDCFLLS